MCFKRFGVKFISFILLLAMLIQIVIPAAANASVEKQFGFEDIRGHWAESAINEFIQKGFISGYSDGSFNPDKEITRSEFVSILNRTFENASDFKGESFKDVHKEDWFYKDIEIAKALGYIDGYPGEVFKPEETLSREEAAVIISRFLNINDRINETQVHAFTDFMDISEWAVGGVSSLMEYQFINGLPDGTFLPKNSISRSEAVIILSKALKKVSAATGIEGKVYFNGSPLAESEVKIFRSEENTPVYQGVTDARGAFCVELNEGSYNITAVQDENVNYCSNIKVRKGYSSLVKIGLKKGCEVKGRLVDKDGKVLANKTVYFKTNPLFIANTDEKGYFKLNLPKDRKYTVFYKDGEELYELSSFQLKEQESLDVGEISYTGEKQEAACIEAVSGRNNGRVSSGDGEDSTPELKNPQILGIAPESGLFGEKITVSGKDFGTDSTKIRVVFTAAAQGEMDGGIVSASDTRIEVLVPGIIKENSSVVVKVEDRISNSMQFQMLGIGEAEAGENLVAETVESVKNLIAATKHETDIGLTPFLSQENSDGIKAELDTMISEVDSAMESLTQGKTEEQLKILNDVFSNPAVKGQIEELNKISDVLSHSTTSEALGNIIKAKNMLKEVKNLLDNLAYILNIAKSTALVMAAAATYALDFSTAAELTSIASQIQSILDAVINPVREIISGILSILDMSPTKAVADSLVLYGYVNDLGIDQYFTNLEKNFTSREPGPFYEENVNRLVSYGEIIKSDIGSMCKSENVGEEAAEIAIEIKDEYDLDGRLDRVVEAGEQLKAFGAVKFYTEKYDTIQALKEYGENVVPLAQAIEKIKSKAQKKAEDYSAAALINAGYNYFNMPSSLNRKMYAINKNDDIANSQNGITANNFYRMMLSADLLLSRSLSDINFEYFNDVPMEDLIEGSFYLNTDIAPGSISETVYRLVKKVGRISQEEIDAISEGTASQSGIQEDLGCIYAAQPYFFKGNVDFTSRDNSFLNVENVLDRAGTSTDELGISSNPISKVIVKMLVNFVDDKMQELLKIDLTDVDVALKVSFFDDDGTERSESDILDWRWIGEKETVDGVEVENRLMLKAKRPGEENIMITAVLVEGEDYLEESKEAFSIKRRIKAVSGYQSDEPYTKGPEVDSITNIDSEAEGRDGKNNEAYIGDMLFVEGFGFSKDVEGHQSVFFGAAPGYNNTGAAHKWMQAENSYRNFKVEVPDALTGEMVVSVGPDGGSMEKWPGNTLDVKILEPRIDYINPTAIKGEAWPVWGKGFSHTASYNKGIWPGAVVSEVIKPPSISMPMKNYDMYDSEVNSDNHDYLHFLHKRLDFLVPQTAESGKFHINTIGALNSEEKDVEINSFSGKAILSSSGRMGLRPSIARDNSTGKRIAVWIDQNETFGNKLVAAVIGSDGKASNPVVVSENVGGIPSAPEKPCISAENGIYQVAWTGVENGNDEVFFSTSIDGINWSQPVNISGTPYSASIQPVLKATDIDGDGDADGVAAWTEDNGYMSEVHSMVLINDGGRFRTGRNITVSGSLPAGDAAVAADGEDVEVLWSEGSKRDIYIAKYSYENDKLSDAVKVSSTQYQARYPSAVFNTDVFTGKKGVAIAWENLCTVSHGDGRIVDYREDVFFARYEDGVVSIPVNLTNSPLHSQRPVLENDQNNNLALAWIEQGYEEDQSVRTETYPSYIMFARSFNGGKEFHRPYMVLQSHSDSTRLGHPAITADNQGLISVIWQETSGNEGKVVFTTTEGNASGPEESITNDIKGQIVNFSLIKGDNGYILSKEDGTPIRMYPENIEGKPDFSPSGRYMAYPQRWVKEAEADGSHPIGIFSAFNDQAEEVYWSPREDVLSANFIESGFMIFERNGKRKDTFADNSGFLRKAAFNNPWYKDNALVSVFKFGEEERTDKNNIKYYVFTVLDAHTSIWEGNGAQKSQIGVNGDTFPVFSPDGTKIAVIKHKNNDEIYKQSTNPNFTFRGKLYIQGAQGGYYPPLTEDYTASSPSWSPDSRSLVFVNEEADGKYVYMVYPYNKNNAPILLTSGIKDAEIVRFSIDGTKIFVKRQQGYSEIDIQTGNIKAMAGFPEAYARINVPRERLIVSEENIFIEEGKKEKVGIRLESQPDGIVTVNTVFDSYGGISVEPQQLVFNKDDWSVSKELEISADDDSLFEGGRSRVIGLYANSDGRDYNGAECKNIYITVGEDEPDPGDIKAPVWKNGTLSVDRKGGSWGEFSWSGASDESGIKSFRIYVDGVLSREVSAQAAVVMGMEKSHEYTVKVEAVDFIGNESNEGPQINFETEDSNMFYAGDYYDNEGMEEGEGQPVERGWSRQSLYSAPEGSGMFWRFSQEEGLWYSSSPVIGRDNTVYYIGKSYSGEEGYLYAVNAGGSLKWKVYIDKAMEGWQAAPIITKDHQIIVVGKERVFCINENGSIVWTFSPDSGYLHSSGTYINDDRLIPASGAAGKDGTLYIAATNSTYKRLMLYAIKDGQKLWKYQSSMYSDSSNVSTGSIYTQPVVLKDGKILFGKDIVKSSGIKDEILGQVPDLIIKTASVISSNRIYILTGDYIGSEKGALYILDGESRDLLHRVEVDNPLNSGIAVDFKGTAYVGSKNGLLYAVDADGNVKWQFAADGAVEGSPLIDNKGNIYFGTEAGRLYALNDAGEEKWSFETSGAANGEGQIASSALGANKNLYFTTVNGLYNIGNTSGDIIGFEQGSYSVNENEGNVNLVLSRQGDISGQRIVYLEMDAAGTAQGSECGFAQSVVIFNSGESQKTVSIAVYDDVKMDGNKTVIPVISKIVGGASKGSIAKTVVTIIDNEHSDVISLEESSYSVQENQGKIDIKVTRTFGGSNPGNASVDYQTSDGTAVAGTDYENTAGTLNFGQYDTEKTITVPIIDNSIYGANKKFSVILKNAVGGSDLDKVYGEVEIIENDTAPSIEYKIDTLSVDEGNYTVAVSVYRTGDTSSVSGVFVELNSALSTAASGSDIGKFSGIYLEFAQGQSEKSFYITINDDAAEEGSEYVILDLQSPQNAVLGAKWRLSILIKDNETLVKAPLAEAGWEGGYAHIMLTNLIPGAKVRLYKSDGTLERVPFNVGGESYRINSVQEGNGYYVTQEVGGVESAPSNKVDVTGNQL